MDTIEIERPKATRLMYLPEVTECLGVTYPTLRRYIKRGLLAAPRLLDRRVAWTEDEVAAFVERLPRDHPRGRGRPPRRRSEETGGGI